MSAENWGWLQSHFDRLAGTDLLRQGITEGASVDELRAGWDEALEEFKRTREPYLIYP
jgi:uncharacterized protein YbbC (DUF1343 family)